MFLFFFFFNSQFFAGKMEGFGVYEFADSAVYEGEWRNGKVFPECSVKESLFLVTSIGCFRCTARECIDSLTETVTTVTGSMI